MKKMTALVILDGFGHSEETRGNAIKADGIKNISRLLKEYPHTLIEASGEDVGLPDGQMGNSEVGHMNIGAGRISLKIPPFWAPLRIAESTIPHCTYTAS